MTDQHDDETRDAQARAADAGPTGDPARADEPASGAAGEPSSAAGSEPSDDELRAALEAQLKQVKVSDLVVQTVVSLINIAGRRLGLVRGAEDERDLDQVRDAIDAVRALLPVLERGAASELGPIRDALAQLQMAYAKERAAGTPTDGGSEGPTGAKPEPRDEPGQPPGPAQSSGRLWVPGQ